MNLYLKKRLSPSLGVKVFLILLSGTMWVFLKINRKKVVGVRRSSLSGLGRMRFRTPSPMKYFMGRFLAETLSLWIWNIFERNIIRKIICLFQNSIPWLKQFSITYGLNLGLQEAFGKLSWPSGCTKSRFDTALKKLQISLNIARSNDPSLKNDQWLAFSDLYPEIVEMHR